MRRFLVSFVILGLGAVSARAGIVALDLDTQTGSPGETLVFTGVLSNSDVTTIYLNSAQLNLAGDAFSTDFIDPFNDNVPYSLDPGQSTSSIELFGILVSDPFTDPQGTYGGTYTLLGGIDSSAQDILGSASFSVTVNAPEPSVLGVMTAGLAGLMALHWRRSAHGSRRPPPSVTV